MSRNGFLWGLGIGCILIIIAIFLYVSQQAEAQVVSSPCVAPAGSAVNSITYNPDGSVDAMVQFTNGGGIMGVTSIHLPVPQPIMSSDVNPVVVTPAVPWTNANVMAAISPLAAAAKAKWQQTINGTSPIGATSAF